MVMNNISNGILIKHHKKDSNTTTTTTAKYYYSLSCAGELKLFLIAVVLFLGAFVILNSSDLRNCLSSSSSTIHSQFQAPLLPPLVESSSAAEAQDDIIDNNGVLKRQFHPYGSAAYNFIFMSAYRGGPSTFAVVGLSSKPLQIYGKPTYECVWLSGENNTEVASVSAQKILPDWGFGRLYTVLVLNCTFLATGSNTSAHPGDGLGGRLIIRATTNDPALNTTDTITALDETPNDFANFMVEFNSPKPKYDYLYCGSPLYGNLSPQRMREWLAYHVKLFGERSHFVIHDAGGIHSEVMDVLRPWIEKGYVTLQDIREQEKFDGYYHNQFLIVNDCLHKYRFSAKWMFFFDVDEFIYVMNKGTIKSVLDSLSDYTQFMFPQMNMSSKLCLPEDAPTASRKWGLEKLVYRDVKKGVRRDRKYAVQPRNVFATGVHLSQDFVGKTTYTTDGLIRYFHYHGTIAQRQEPCGVFINSSHTSLDGIPYVIDTTMRDLAASVKRFEFEMIGSSLNTTRQ